MGNASRSRTTTSLHGTTRAQLGSRLMWSRVCVDRIKCRSSTRLSAVRPQATHRSCTIAMEDTSPPKVPKRGRDWMERPGRARGDRSLCCACGPCAVPWSVNHLMNERVQIPIDSNTISEA
eukprot:3064494-Prymnesium_polylepis.3